MDFWVRSGFTPQVYHAPVTYPRTSQELRNPSRIHFLIRKRSNHISKLLAGLNEMMYIKWLIYCMNHTVSMSKINSQPNLKRKKGKTWADRRTYWKEIKQWKMVTPYPLAANPSPGNPWGPQRREQSAGPRRHWLGRADIWLVSIRSYQRLKYFWTALYHRPRHQEWNPL